MYVISEALKHDIFDVECFKRYPQVQNGAFEVDSEIGSSISGYRISEIYCHTLCVWTHLDSGMTKEIIIPHDVVL